MDGVECRLAELLVVRSEAICCFQSRCIRSLYHLSTPKLRRVTGLGHRAVTRVV